MKTIRYTRSPMPFFVAILSCYSGVSISVSSENTEPVSKQSVETNSFITSYGIGRQNFESEERVQSPCSVEDIPSSGDVFVDCRDRNISRIDPRWFPANTTILNLDSNNISRLENNTFLHLRFLRDLTICCSNVKEIQTNALRGLDNLESLNLENNKLPLRQRAFPGTMFSHVSSLRHLFIQNNMNVHTHTEYISIDDKEECSEVNPYFHYIDIFESLPALESLSIDTFPHVCLGHEFSKLHHLRNLRLFGSNHAGFVFLTNETFIGLRTVNLTHLSITSFVQPVHTETGLFQYLNHLESLVITNSHFGNQLVAKLMWPFVNKTMSYLHLSQTGIYHGFQSPENVFEDGIIRKETTEYLGKICVPDFAWIDSNLFAIEHGALITPTWRRCLKALDLSQNDFNVAAWRVSLFDLISQPGLVSITIESRIPDGTNYEIDAKISQDTIPREVRAEKNSEDRDGETDHLNKYVPNSADHVTVNSADPSKVVTLQEAAMHRSPNNVLPNVNISHAQQQDKPGWLQDGHVQLWFPINIRKIRLVHLGNGEMIKDGTTLVFKRTDHLQECYLTHMPRFFNSPARILGLEHLKLLDISYSLFKVRQNFFDDFPGIEILVSRSLLPKNYFDSVMPCKNLIRKMSNLRYLDISNNGLKFLFHGTFSTNPELTQLILTENRFSTIPFDLHLTPKLKVLDLSQNAILYLDEDARAAIDLHVAKVDAFYLKLEGNGLVCVCSQMAFLVWLDTTTAVLDKGGNYSCTSENGLLSHTVSHTDLPGFWRKCNGWSWLMTSIVLALVLTLSFLTTYLTARFKCAIKAFTMRLLFPQFRPLRPRDYKTDIIVCYADDDFRFVRNILLGFLEDELHLRTYIHQRDMELGGHKDDHIHKAIENSWRVMLVITDTFLQRYDMADIIMKFACYSVGPANQGRVFAVVEQSQINLIPRNLHAVLDDERIIVIHDLDDLLGYEQKQSIKNCLRPVN